MKKGWLLGLIALLLSSCGGSSAPLHQYTKGNVLASNDFSNAASFEQGGYNAATLQIVNNAYQIDVLQADNVLWWGQWGDTYTDTIIDVDTEQQSQALENAYGVMCRVQGTVGQPQSVDPTLAALMSDSTPEATAEATRMAAAEAASTATAEATSESASTAIAQATAETTAGATGAATPEATTESASAATAEATRAASAEATIESASTATAEATSAATTEATDAATAEVLLPLPTALLTATLTPTSVPISNGDGYLFLIQGGGTFAIMRSSGRNLTPLVNWTSSDAIKQGPAQNHIRAICAGNYLAFYVNDQFLGDATDDTYSSGQVGLGASSANRTGTRIAFDNLVIAAPVQK